MIFKRISVCFLLDTPYFLHDKSWRSLLHDKALAQCSKLRPLILAVSNPGKIDYEQHIPGINDCPTWQHFQLGPINSKDKKTPSMPNSFKMANWHEPRKKTAYFPLNPGCLMTGSLFHGLWNNPHMTGARFSIPNKSLKNLAVPPETPVTPRFPYRVHGCTTSHWQFADNHRGWQRSRPHHRSAGPGEK